MHRERNKDKVESVRDRNREKGLDKQKSGDKVERVLE